MTDNNRQEQTIKHLKEREQYRFKLRQGLRKSWSAVAKHKVLFLLLFILVFGFWVRVLPLELHAVESYVENIIDDAVHDRLLVEVHEQYPMISPDDKLAFAQKKLSEYKKTAEYKDQFTEIIAQKKAFVRSSDGMMYPLANDPYHHLYYTKNVLKNGHIGDELREGKSYEALSQAPAGRLREQQRFLPHFAAGFHNIANLFGDFSLLQTFSMLPVFIGVLCLLFFFLIGYELFGTAGGFFVSFLAIFDYSLLNRTIVGFVDTDMMNVLFTLLLIYLIIKSITALLHSSSSSSSSASSKKLFPVKETSLMVLAGLVIGLFAFTWTGWWYIFGIILGSLGLLLIYLLITERFSVSFKKICISSGVFFVSSFVFTSLLVNVKTFFNLFFKPLIVIVKLESVFVGGGITHLRPNMYRFVSELSATSFSEVNMYLGGSYLLISFVLGLLIFSWMFYQSYKQIKHQVSQVDKQKQRSKTAVHFFWCIFFFAYSAIMLYILTFGIRFLLYAGIPFTIIVGSFFGFLYNQGAKKIAAVFHIEKQIVVVIVVLIFFLAAGISPIPPFCSHGRCKEGVNFAKLTGPLFDDGWEEVTTTLRTKTAPDAVVTAWWDPGHFIKSIGERGVNIDGASQTRPQVHWIGKLLSIDDEQEALGILQMLDCGNYLAYERLNKETKSAHTTLKILEDLVLLSKKEAEVYLQAMVDQKKITKESVGYLLEKTKCSPPEGYVLLTEDLEKIMPVVSRVGFWDTDKAQTALLANRDPEQAKVFMKDYLNYTEEQAVQTLVTLQNFNTNEEREDWIGKSLGVVRMDCYPQKEFLRCTAMIQEKRVGFLLDQKTKEVYTVNGKHIDPLFHSIVWADETGFHERFFPEPKYDLSIVVDSSWSDEQSKVYFIENPLQRSLYIRLQYLQGVGLKGFSLFSKGENLRRRTMTLWKVNWDERKEDG